MNELMSVQAPSTQASPSWQAWPQPPQLKNSLRMSTQLEPQAVSVPQSGRQVPSVHDWPAGQTVPPAPQLLRSPATFAGRPAQSFTFPLAVKGAQLPFTQAVSAGHTLPGAPQLFSSAAYDTHAPPTIARPAGQVAVHVAA